MAEREIRVYNDPEGPGVADGMTWTVDNAEGSVSVRFFEQEEAEQFADWLRRTDPELR